ncbi:tetratricopeptide repeat protein [candidate division KSB1 bacterium]|nr:tetratricopeptide repeat protein [candidate division KSB1 bacterium]
MRKWYGFAVLFIVVGLLAGCGGKKKLTEEQLYAKAVDYENKEMWDSEGEVLEEIITRFPESAHADSILYKLGISYASNLKDFEKSVASFKKLVEAYPESKYVIQASFMIGYRYANDEGIRDLDKARECYEQFLQKYPDHELATSVKWELDHLGQDITDIELQLQAEQGEQN